MNGYCYEPEMNISKQGVFITFFVSTKIQGTIKSFCVLAKWQKSIRFFTIHWSQGSGAGTHSRNSAEEAQLRSDIQKISVAKKKTGEQIIEKKRRNFILENITHNFPHDYF